jgi:hypothetical protein
MLIPMIAVPLLAMFGIPPAGQLDASSATDSNGYQNPLDTEFSALGQSDYCSADDLFTSTMPTDDPILLNSNSDPRPTEAAASAQDWDDPFDKPQTAGATRWIPPARSLEEWDFDLSDRASPANRGGTPKPAARSTAIAFAAPPNSTSNATPIETSGRFESQNPTPNPRPQQTRFNQVLESDALQQSAAPANRMTWQSAVTALKELGIHHYHLEPGSRSSDFLFTCSYTPPDNPRVTHRFEAESGQPLEAVHKVIQQVRQWRLTR